MPEDIFSDFTWHSSIGIDFALDGNKKFVTRLPNTKRARAMFTASSDNTLIHKSTKALWRITPDQASIEPVFATEVLSEEDCDGMMEEEG